MPRPCFAWDAGIRFQQQLLTFPVLFMRQVGKDRPLAKAFENRSIAVPGGGNSVRFVGFEVQFDATADERFLKV